jgi:hypothetical protein
VPLWPRRHGRRRQGRSRTRAHGRKAFGLEPFRRANRSRKASLARPPESGAYKYTS